MLTLFTSFLLVKLIVISSHIRSDVVRIFSTKNTYLQSYRNNLVTSRRIMLYSFVNQIMYHKSMLRMGMITFFLYSLVSK